MDVTVVEWVDKLSTATLASLVDEDCRSRQENGHRAQQRPQTLGKEEQFRRR